jgi:Protein of unknown function (DUF4238)
VKHHYVPAFYLRSFVDAACPAEYEPYLWVVDLDTGKTRRQSPDNTAALTDYYAVGDGDSRYDVEKYLSEVESKTAPVVAKVLGDTETIEADDKRVLSYFAALQIIRVPQFRDRIEAFITEIGQVVNAMMIQSRDRYEAGLRQAMPDRDFTAEEVERLYAGARDLDSYKIVANPEAALGHGLRVVPQIADLLNRMSWAVMEPAGAENYWSSDNPLYYINPESKHPFLGHALGVKGVEVNLPLGPRRCLLMAWSDIAGPRTPINDLRIAQERGIAGAKRYLFCSTEQDAQAAFDAHRRLFPRRVPGAMPP